MRGRGWGGLGMRLERGASSGVGMGGEQRSGGRALVLRAGGKGLTSQRSRIRWPWGGCGRRGLVPR